MSRKRMLFLSFGFFVAMLVAAFVYIQVLVGAAGERITDQPSSAQVIIIPGASVLQNRYPSDILRDRLLTAITLYEAGLAETIIASGDGGSFEYNELFVMRDFLIEAGVAPEDIFLDHAGFDSYDTLYRARDVFGVSRAIVVSQAYHLPRLLYIGESLGLDVSGVPADRQPYRKAEWFAFRERFANVKAVLEVLIGKQPTFLGEAIDLSGDGRVTHE